MNRRDLLRAIIAAPAAVAVAKAAGAEPPIPVDVAQPYRWGPEAPSCCDGSGLRLVKRSAPGWYGQRGGVSRDICLECSPNFDYVWKVAPCPLCKTLGMHEYTVATRRGTRTHVNPCEACERTYNAIYGDPVWHATTVLFG